MRRPLVLSQRSNPGLTRRIAAFPRLAFPAFYLSRWGAGWGYSLMPEGCSVGGSVVTSTTIRGFVMGFPFGEDDAFRKSNGSDSSRVLVPTPLIIAFSRSILTQSSVA